MKVDAFTEQQSLDKELKRFWELKSLGILKDEYDTFTQHNIFQAGKV